MKIIRSLNKDEIALISWMIKGKLRGQKIIDTLDKLLVEEMKDGGMGSLKVNIEGKDDRIYSRELAKADLFDIDGIPVFISINLDQNDDFYEFEVFKADFSKLQKIPSIQTLPK